MSGAFVVGLDHSPQAAGVLQAALELAESLDRSLILVRATSVAGELPIEAYASDPRAIADLLAVRALDDLKTMASAVPRERIAAIRVEEGPAAEVIDRIARDEDADAIVIGAHGYGVVERLLGTVASKVVNHADRSVIVVREPGRLRPSQMKLPHS